MVALGAGVVMQRFCQLLGFLLVGNTLGVAGLGLFAQGQALAAVLTVLAGTGVRNLTARRLAARPDAARELVFAAVRQRLALGAIAATVVIGCAFATSTAPWFWVFCALQVLPAAFDLKNLLDAAGRTRNEVALETGVAALQLLAIVAWFCGGGDSATSVAVIALACRCLYAALAIPAVARLRGGEVGERAPAQPAMAVAQTAHELMTLGDVWLVALLFGDLAAGYYAFAVRLTAAALVPSSQLARLLLPHLLHAGADGDASRTFSTALRATALATLPMLAGGAVLAVALSASVAGFAQAAPTLRWLLLAGCLQHLAWQCSHALLALHRDRAFANSLLWPAVLHLGCLVVFAQSSNQGPPDAASGAALAAVIAQCLYLAAGLIATRSLWQRRPPSWVAPLVVAGATGLVTHLVGMLPSERNGPVLLLQLLAGATTFGLGIWVTELRGRWRRLGDGLAQASGLRA